MGWFILAHFFSTILAFSGLGRGSAADKDLEILILRHQLNIVARKQQKSIKPTRPEKLILAVLVHKLKRRTHQSTQQLQEILVKAEAEAKRLKDEYVSVEHLVMAIVSVPDTAAARASTSPACRL